MLDKIRSFTEKITRKKVMILSLVIVGTAVLTAGIAVSAQKIHVKRHTLTVAEAYDLSINPASVKMCLWMLLSVLKISLS